MDGYQELTNRLQLHLNRQFQLQLQVVRLFFLLGWLVSQLDCALMVGCLAGSTEGCVVSQEAAKDRERLKELEAECLILKGRLNR